MALMTSSSQTGFTDRFQQEFDMSVSSGDI